MYLGEALLALGEVALKQEDRRLARSAFAEADMQLRGTVGEQAPISRQATRRLATL